MRPASPSDRPGEAGGHSQEIDLLTGRTADTSRPVRIGTLSWTVPRRERGLLAPDQFLATLQGLHAKSPEPRDLLLCSGRTLAAEPPVQDVLARTGGADVLFEAINPDQSTARWVLAHGGPEPRADRLRTEQSLVRGGDDPATYERLAGELASGGGVVRLSGGDFRLVLLICGENNALDTYGRDRSALCRPGPGLADKLGGRWVALNPAHSPYWPQIARKGFAKVGKVSDGGETMARTVAGRGPYADGTSPPVAFVHANNFFDDEPRTKEYASVAFDSAGRMTPVRTEEGTVAGVGGGMVNWLFSAYEIPV